MPTTFYTKWDEIGTKTYHTGCDRGVLYVSNPSGTGSSAWGDGVAWSGLRSVSESPDGAEEQAFYADNIKYLSLRGAENFGGSIGCYDTPEEFDACDGTAQLLSGFKGITIKQQSRLPFCFTYRTLKGNDQVGDNYGYLIHLVYNATASPSSRENQSVNESPSPLELSYEFKTTPIEVAGFKPTSHIIIDTTSEDFKATQGQAKLTAIESWLYGTAATTEGGTGTPGKILLPTDLLTIMQ